MPSPFIILGLVFQTALAANATAAEIPKLGLPIACTPGEDCFIQKYVDVDGADAIADYACGHLSSDGHKGTDFRVLPGASADVLAAADGTVSAVRDGMPDNTFVDPHTAPSDRACGNAVLIDHGAGVETISCHMQEGSVAVAVGDRVEKGDVLGQVGASGQADFRHVHFQVMADGSVYDPFTGAVQGAEACGADGAHLFDDAAWRALAETPRTAILKAGFADGAVTIGDIQAASLPTEIDRDAEALVAYALVFGAEEGDRHHVSITGPGIDVDHQSAQERSQAQSMRFAGKRLDSGLQPGTYTMVYEVSRDGTVIDEATREFTID